MVKALGWTTRVRSTGGSGPKGRGRGRVDTELPTEMSSVANGLMTNPTAQGRNGENLHGNRFSGVCSNERQCNRYKATSQEYVGGWSQVCHLPNGGAVMLTIYFICGKLHHPLLSPLSLY